VGATQCPINKKKALRGDRNIQIEATLGYLEKEKENVMPTLPKRSCLSPKFERITVQKMALDNQNRWFSPTFMLFYLQCEPKKKILKCRNADECK
jgi:hypothetical protein